MLKYALAYIVVAVVFAALDLIWLSVAGPLLYRPALGPLLAAKASLSPAAVFYLLYVAGVTLFVVVPALQAGSWSRATLLGAAFGLVAYGTYDLTNQATLKVWSTQVSLADMAWGAFATAVAATAGVLLAGKTAKVLGWS